MPPLPADSSKTAALKRGLRNNSCIPKSKKIVSLVSCLKSKNNCTAFQKKVFLTIVLIEVEC